MNWIMDYLLLFCVSNRKPSMEVKISYQCQRVLFNLFFFVWYIGKSVMKQSAMESRLGKSIITYMKHVI